MGTKITRKPRELIIHNCRKCNFIWKDYERFPLKCPECGYFFNSGKKHFMRNEIYGWDRHKNSGNMRGVELE